MRLTDLSVSKLPAPETGQKTYFDDLTPGFGIRITSRGTKSWVIVYSSKRLLKTIGRYPDKSLKIARQDAKAFQVAQSPNPTRITVSEALQSFLEHSERHNRPRTTADYKRLLNRHLPTGRLRDLSKQGLLEKLNRLADTPAEQAHAITAIKVFLNWCASAGHIDHNPIAAVRGVGRIKQRDRIYAGRTESCAEARTRIPVSLWCDHCPSDLHGPAHRRGRQASPIVHWGWHYHTPEGAHEEQA